MVRLCRKWGLIFNIKKRVNDGAAEHFNDKVSRVFSSIWRESMPLQFIHLMPPLLGGCNELVVNTTDVLLQGKYPLHHFLYCMMEKHSPAY